MQSVAAVETSNGVPEMREMRSYNIELFNYFGRMAHKKYAKYDNLLTFLLRLGMSRLFVLMWRYFKFICHFLAIYFML